MARQGTAAHFVKVADIDELQVAAETERSEQPDLRILLVQAVDLMQRRLDSKTIVAIDRRGAAKRVVAFEHEHAPARAGAKRGRREAAQA